MTYADPKMCHGWRRAPHRADENTTTVYIPDRYTSIGVYPMTVGVQLCDVCRSRYDARPGDYQDGRVIDEAMEGTG
jgi:hypothetical protein